MFLCFFFGFLCWCRGHLLWSPRSSIYRRGRCSDRFRIHHASHLHLVDKEVCDERFVFTDSQKGGPLGPTDLGLGICALWTSLIPGYHSWRNHVGYESTTDHTINHHLNIPHTKIIPDLKDPWEIAHHNGFRPCFQFHYCPPQWSRGFMVPVSVEISSHLWPKKMAGLKNLELPRIISLWRARKKASSWSLRDCWP